MGHLIKAEFYKLRKSLSYKVLLAAFLVFEILFVRNEVTSGIRWTGIVYTGAEWLYRVPGQASYYVGFLYLFAADYVAGEFRNRTLVSGCLCGFLRRQVLYAKAAAYFAGILPFMLIHTVTGPVVWTMQFGFGMGFNVDTIMLVLSTLLYCTLGHLVFGGMGFLGALIARNRIGTVGLSLGVSQILGIVNANASLLENPVLTAILKLTIFFQLSEFLGNRPLIYTHVPLWVMVLTSVIAVAFILLLAKVHFEKHDLK